MNPITRECQDCPDLQELLADIECTILDLVNNKYNSVIYGVKGCCNTKLLKSLIHYKEIITARTYNPNYPCGVFSNNELLSKARLLAYKTNCSKCPECEEIFTTTTTLPTVTTCVTYLIQQVGGEFSPSILFNYISCEGVISQGSIGGGQPEQEICALRGSLTLSPTLYTEIAIGCVTTTLP